MKILYVEDNPRDADLTRRELVKAMPGLVLDSVSTLREAYARLELPAGYDLVLTDLKLPDGHGMELLDHIRARALDVAVVILTGQGDEETAIAALKAGADDYGTKRPNHLRRLPIILESALERFRSQASQRTHPIRLLYAEHSAADVDLTRRHLARHAPHIRLDAVNTVPEVFQRLAAANAYDVLLLDYRLPGSNALEVLKELHETRNLDIPIVLITGQGDEELAVQAFKLGASDYVPKTSGYLFPLTSILENAFHRAQLAREQAALRAAEFSFRHLFANNPHPMWVYDLQELGFLEVNDTAIARYGYTRQEFLHMRVPDIHAPESRARLLADQQRPQPNVHFGGEWQHLLKDGTAITVEVTAHTLEFNGRPAALVVAQDISARKRAEAALLESEARFRRLAENAQDIISRYQVQAPRGYEYVSPAATAIAGYAPEEYYADPGMPFKLVHPDDHPLLEQLLADQLPWQDALPMRWICKDGHIIWIEQRNVPIRDAAGRLVAIEGIARDITLRKQSEEQAQNRTKQLALLYDAGLTLNRALDPHTLMESLLDIAGRVVGADRADFLRYDGANQNLVYEIGGGYDATLDLTALEAQTFALGQQRGLVGLVAVQRAPLYLPDVRHDDRWIPFDPAIRSGLWVPVERENDLLGVLAMTSTRVDAFSPDDQRLVALFANQVAVALENARLFAETRRRLLELQAVDHISTVLRAATTLEGMLPQLLDETLAALATDTGSIALYDSNRDELRDAVARGWFNNLIHMPVKPPDGIQGHVFATGEPHVSRELAGDAQVHPLARDRIPAGWSGACVPIRTATETIGVLFAGKMRGREWSPDQVHLLNTFAEMAGSAIHRMRLYEETQRSLERLSALRAIDTAINSSLDLHLTLDTLLDQTLLQLHADAAEILLMNAPHFTLEFVAARGFRTRAIERTRLRLGEDHAGRAALERRTVCVPDLATSDSARRALIKEEGFLSYCGTPLIAKGQVKGIIGIFQRRPFEPDAEWLDFMEALARQAAIAVDNAELFEGLQRANSELALAYDATLEGWSHALDLRDKETEGHTERVSEMTLHLARAVGITGSELVHIRRGALLHDIGKVGVPDSILLKPGPLTEEEWTMMRKHPQFAYEMLSPIAYLRPALDIPYYHHERWDGTGYPRGLKGDQIPLAARVFAVVDVWDALISRRPYRAAWPVERALAHIREQAGRHFDPQIAAAFMELMSRQDVDEEDDETGTANR